LKQSGSYPLRNVPPDAHTRLRKDILLNALLLLVISLFLSGFLSGCDPIRPKALVTDTEFSLINQNNEPVVFPDAYAGNIVLISYVYTYCPDICPMITYNMRDVQRAFPNEDRLMLVSVSFDPERDTPEILKKYADSYKLDLEHWDLLTGDPRVVKKLLDATEIRTVKTPTTFLEGGEAFYFIDHTDKISLIDADGFLRRNYSGSELDIDQVVQDIQTLLAETTFHNTN